MRSLFRLIVAGLVIAVLMYGLLGWVRGPAVETLPAIDPPPMDHHLIDLPAIYRCGAGAEAYRVKLTEADRIIIEGMHSGGIQTPWRVVGCDGKAE